jgi:hypothetical protein
MTLLVASPFDVLRVRRGESAVLSFLILSLSKDEGIR